MSEVPRATGGMQVITVATRRGPMAQGQIWCASRVIGELEHRRRLCASANALLLASCFQDVWSMTARPRTNKVPGMSWHNFGKAADFALQAGNDVIWRGAPMVAACECAKGCGLASAHRFSIGQEMGHVQLHAGTPLEEFALGSWRELQEMLEREYGDDWSR